MWLRSRKPANKVKSSQVKSAPAYAPCFRMKWVKGGENEMTVWVRTSPPSSPPPPSQTRSHWTQSKTPTESSVCEDVPWWKISGEKGLKSRMKEEGVVSAGAAVYPEGVTTDHQPTADRGTSLFKHYSTMGRILPVMFFCYRKLINKLV